MFPARATFEGAQGAFKSAAARSDRNGLHLESPLKTVSVWMDDIESWRRLSATLHP